MAKAKKPANSSAEIMEKLLGEVAKSRPIYLGDIHRNIHKFAKKYKFDANEVGQILRKIMLETFKETFEQDFSKKPKFRGGHHGH